MMRTSSTSVILTPEKPTMKARPYSMFGACMFRMPMMTGAM